MTILEPVQPLKGGPWVFPRKLLIHYFIHCAPLEITEGSVARTSYVGVDVDECTLIWALYSCGDYRAVITCVGLMKGSHHQSWMILRMHTHSLIKVSRCNKAIEILMRGDTWHKNRDYSSTQCSLRGLAYETKGGYSSALEYHQMSLNIKLQIHSYSPHPDIASSYNNIGNVYQSQGNYSAALEYHHKSLDIRLKINDDSPHPDIASSYNNIGIVYQSQGDYSSALKCYWRSRDLLQSSELSQTHPLYAMVMSNLGSG